MDPAAFVDWCRAGGVTLFTGVPDSVLRSFNDHLLRVAGSEHVVAANEGNAVGVAIGHHLLDGGLALVYLQNSGFGNAVNPLLSLADPEVYGVPMLVLVGWRGGPGAPDEPQHRKQGRVMPALLDALELPWAELPADPASARAAVTRAVATASAGRTPYVLLVAKGTFGAGVPATPERSGRPTREQALVELVSAIGDDAVVVATTGMLGRELAELRRRGCATPGRDFLTIGGMGHASSIALGMARAAGHREVWCLDGDGALLMHLGALAVIAQHAPPRLFHVVFNNGVHDSVGGTPTAIATVDLPAAARALGYRCATTCDSTVDAAVARLRAAGGPALLELRVRPGSRPDLARPAESPSDSGTTFTSIWR